MYQIAHAWTSICQSYFAKPPTVLICQSFYRQCFLLYGKLDIDISNVHVSKSITGRGIIDWMPGCSSVSYSQCLLDEEGKLLPVKDSAIVNTSSIQ